MATGFNTQVGSGEYRLQFETDNKEYYLLMQETARRCVDGKSKTNADRIRAMSDEGLSVWLMRLHTICECCSAKEECDTIENDEVCRRGVLEWLKKISEGE